MKQKIINLQQKLSQGLVGREDTIKTALLAMLAGENVLLIGPPGTGKSMVSRRISQSLAPQQDTSPYLNTFSPNFPHLKSYSALFLSARSSKISLNAKLPVTCQTYK